MSITYSVVIKDYTVFIEAEKENKPTTLAEVNMSNTTTVSETVKTNVNVNKAAKDFLNGLIYKIDVIRGQVEGRMFNGCNALNSVPMHNLSMY